ncbi:MAG: dTMP kinase [Candidatus Micrarchaeota archaeon]|nr:dTMP kinase [Candidatus Micrarchaeota archaeon]
MLLVFEGIDGAGKATQVRLLCALLRQRGVRYSIYKYPTKRAKEALAHLAEKRQIAADRLAAIFAQDIMAQQEEIRKQLSCGRAVICDRYLHSTLAYQAVGEGYLKLKRKLSSFGAIKPDLVLLLDIHPKRSLLRKRRQKKPDRHEKDGAFLLRVRKNYLRMAKEGFLSCAFAVIDASGEKDAVAASVAAHVEPLITAKMGMKKAG